ncbi:putative response regulator [Methanocella paludicola SANAE]|uniref:Response regulator n=1 Tax=Methanocella paludicola (strain DSM 17711 / JCM 13418 / NBRC 101707 / SANAE) TaxID=304371 RepID=D1YVS5_METPS|nr:response regulator [Methanocella paludicola]BAI60547.1 putative response regulator [Methanocella paludicola SANAE]
MARTSRKLILITDDEPDVADVIAEKLESIGYRTLKAHSGAECIEMARKSHPDLLFLDIRMEPMNGWEVADAMKNDGNLRDIPVIMVTGVELTLRDIMDRAHLIENYIMKSDASLDKLREAVEDVLTAKTDVERIMGMAGKSGVQKEMLTELKDRYLRKFTQYRSLKKKYSLYSQMYGENGGEQSTAMLSSLKKGLEQQAEDLSHIEKMLMATQPVKRAKRPKKKI